MSRRWTSLALAGALLAGLSLTQCSSGSGAKSVCTPGASASCVCSSGDKGAQVCASDGSGYGACSCQSGGGGSSGGAGAGGSAGSGGAGGSAGSGGGPSTFVGTWDVNGTETFTGCVGSAAGRNATDPFSAVVVWSVGGPGLIGDAQGCDFDDTVSGNVATLSTPVHCGGTQEGVDIMNTYDTFTWTLDPGGTTAAVTQTGSQTTESAAGNSDCQIQFSLTATKQ